MSSRISIIFLFLLLLLVPHIEAKNKKKQLLPDYVLHAERVFVVIPPDAGEALSNPRENRTAQDDVERALMKWGRFKLTTDSQSADLIIAVRKGNKSGPIIAHSLWTIGPLSSSLASRMLAFVEQQHLVPRI